MSKINWTIQPREGFREKLDDLRRVEPDLPSRTEMLHRLVDRALEALQKEAAE